MKSKTLKQQTKFQLSEKETIKQELKQINKLANLRKLRLNQHNEEKEPKKIQKYSIKRKLMSFLK